MDALAQLGLQQLFDSQFPVGSFAHSGGIETYAQMGATVDDLEALIRNMVRHGWGRLDLAAAALAYEASSDDAALADLAWVVDASKVVAGPRNASLQMGRRLLGLATRLYPDVTLSVDPTHHCVVVGAVGARLGIPRRALLMAYGQSNVMASLAAATRCMRLSPARAQEMLAALQPTIVEAADAALADPEASLYTCTPGLDLRAHQQAGLYSRLFQS